MNVETSVVDLPPLQWEAPAEGKVRRKRNGDDSRHDKTKKKTILPNCDLSSLTGTCLLLEKDCKRSESGPTCSTELGPIWDRFSISVDSAADSLIIDVFKTKIQIEIEI